MTTCRDPLTPSSRRKAMQGNKSSGTRPELEVRAMLDGLGLPYMANCPELPGKPDAYLLGRKAVFVHGCFWHNHGCRERRISPGFWADKLARNVERDAENKLRLEEMGVAVLEVWECELKTPEEAFARIAEFAGVEP